MKLFWSAASPYVRKVMAVAIARDLHERITLIPTNPHQSPPDFVAANPLSRVPCLVTEDGLALFDSPVICEYLDSREDGIKLFPNTAAARWVALKHQAMGDGIMDAAVARRQDGLRPVEAARTALMARNKAAIDRTLAALEADVPHGTLDIGTISIGCALGYLDFRFPHEPWRDACPKLAAWFAAFSQEPCMAMTAPREPA
ncbi:MAG TPA: glutathione S-transferase [Acetobacteraceae bacterium]|nr:glutathione S-transferase [Acetobacteraceae bacterium]